MELVAVEYRWKRQIGLAVTRLLVREYGASEGTVIDLNGEHEELLESLLQAHAIRLGLHLLKWEEGMWQETE